MCWNKCLKIHIFDTVKSCAYLTSTCLQIKIDMRRHETTQCILSRTSFSSVPGSNPDNSDCDYNQHLGPRKARVRPPAPARLRARRKMYRGHGAELRTASVSLLSSARLLCGMWRCPAVPGLVIVTSLIIVAVVSRGGHFLHAAAHWRYLQFSRV